MARIDATLVTEGDIGLFGERDAISYEFNESYINGMPHPHLHHNGSVNDDYIFDRTYVKVIFITLYSIVFVCCCIGNLMVILAVIFSRRLRGMTNVFLANLAMADFCVGIFCVYQTLTNYLMNSWQFGEFLCKAYMFAHALSYTASILILLLVCIERYMAIVHPIKCKSMLTKSRLTCVIGMVWILAALYALPKLIYAKTIDNKLKSGGVDIICVPNIKKHNKNVIDAVNFIFLYLLPLVLMCCLYRRIAVDLWRSGVTLGGPGLVASTRNGQVRHIHTSCRNALRARRGVIRMLVTVVVIFAVCNLPQQVRIIWQHCAPTYDPILNVSTLLTVSTFLISYTNSCLNPFLYAFLSRNFRKGMRELLFCSSSSNRSRTTTLAIGCTSGDTTRQENGTNAIERPSCSLLGLTSVPGNYETTQPISRHGSSATNRA